MQMNTETKPHDQYKDILTGSIVPKEITSNGNCSTGDSDHLLPKLKAAISKATAIDIIVAFLMESGVRLLASELREAVNRKIPIRILTGNYLNITQPQALYMIKDILGKDAELHFYNVLNKSFHPKAYIFSYEDGGEIFIGSSNISKSALTDGIEWNYSINKNTTSEAYTHFKNIFEDLYNSKSMLITDLELKRYSQSWIRPRLYKNTETEAEDITIPLFQPRGAQIEALYELKKFREEGYDRGLVVVATGIGKTYLSAFDSLSFKRILFVAHREEILKQSAAAFHNVRPEKTLGFFNSDHKDNKSDLIFASVQTLGKEEYLKEAYFSQDYFDYVIIDEVHHAAAASYKKLLEYFKPSFLLGLTATPERMDNADVFAIFNHDVVYETRLHSAINKGWLVPFRYYGIYDESVDYDSLEYKNGKYNDKDLEDALMISKRAELILKNFLVYASVRALGFCSSRKHAEYMAEYFMDNGIKVAAVVSEGKGRAVMERAEALKQLQSGQLKVIFSVDMFNEGVDIPSVDMVMFLRPTESPTVFLQQLGRGLRKSKGKKYLNVLDFIGNYKKANLVPFFLTGKQKDIAKGSKGQLLPKEEEYPEDCFVNIDFRLIDIFRKIAAETKKIEDRIREEFYRIKEDLSHRPSRLELFTYLDDDIYENMRKKSALNIFNDYTGFLKSLQELNEAEEKLISSTAQEFLKKMETTPMVQTYKMPLLLAFYNEGKMKLKLKNKDIYESFRNFYSRGDNAADLLRNKNTASYKSFGEKEYLRMAKNPKDAFMNSAKEFFYEDGPDYCLTQELEAYTDNAEFLKHFKDVIDYRASKFYKERLEKQYEDLQ